MNIQVKPLNQVGKVVIILCLIVSVASGIFLYQDQVVKRQGLVGKWIQSKGFGGRLGFLTIAPDGTLEMDGKKGNWKYLNGVVTLQFVGTENKYKLFLDMPNRLSNHVPDGANFTKVSA